MHPQPVTRQSLRIACTDAWLLTTTPNICLSFTVKVWLTNEGAWLLVSHALEEASITDSLVLTNSLLFINCCFRWHLASNTKLINFVNNKSRWLFQPHTQYVNCVSEYTETYNWKWIFGLFICLACYCFLGAFDRLCVFVWYTVW